MSRKELRKEREIAAKKKKASLKQKRLSTAVVSGAMLSIVVGGVSAPSAFASEGLTTKDANEKRGSAFDSGEDSFVYNELAYEASVSQALLQQNSSESKNLVQRTSTGEEQVEYSAHIVLRSSDGSGEETVSLRNGDEKVFTALNDRGISTSLLRNDKGDIVKESDLKNITVPHGEEYVLTTSERNTDKREVVLDYTIERVEDDNLLAGEEEVVQEGRKGKAEESTTTHKNTGSTGTEKNLTVLEAPQTKIIHVGTMEPEVPVITNAADGEESGFSAETQQASVGSYTADSTEESDFVYHEDEDVSELNQSILDDLMSQVGNRYVWGGTTPGGGFDCSGIIQWAYAQNGVSIPRVSLDQGRAGKQVSWSDIQPGDFIYTAAHIGVYIGGGQMVHASSPSSGVKVSGVDYFRNNNFAVSRILD